MANIFDLFKRGVHIDGALFQQGRVSKILGHDQPMYTLPHIQWNNHVNNANHITNLKNPPDTLTKIGRYVPIVRIKR